MKTGELLGKQLEKLGVDITSEELKSVLGITVEIPDALALKLDGLMTVDSAKNNSDVKTHFIKNYTSGLSQSMNEKLKKLGLSNDEVDEIFKEDAAFGKKIENALEKLAAAEKNKAKAKKDGDGDAEKAFKDQIEKLNADLASFKETSKNREAELLTSFEQERINEEVAREFLSKPWSSAYPDGAQDRIVVANTFLSNELQQIGAKIVRDTESKKLKLVQAKNPELDYFDSSNKKVNFDSLVTKIGTDKKLFAVSAPAGQGTPKTIVGDANPQGTIRTNNPTLNALRESQNDQAQNIAKV